MALTSVQLALQRLRRDSRKEATMQLIAYESVEGGIELAWAGDDEAPFVKLLTAGVDALHVQGVIAHDDPDNEVTNFPVKIGGHASSGIRTAVTLNDDIADISVDLNGRVRTRLSGTNEGTNIPADVPLDSANALEVGGQVGHDDVDEGYPLKVGGRAASETPAAVASGDRTNWFFSLEGRAIVNQDLGNAGEDLVNEVVRTVPGALAVEEHSLDVNYLAGSATNAVVKSTAGRAYQFIIGNPTVGTLNFQLHNLAAAPGGGAVPVMTPVAIPAGGGSFIDFGEYGFYCSVGITVASSSVYATFTGSAGLHITTLFK